MVACNCAKKFGFFSFRKGVQLEFGNSQEITHMQRKKILLIMLVTIQVSVNKTVVKNIPHMNIHLHIKFLSP